MCDRAHEKNGAYELGDDGSAYCSHSSLVRKYVRKDDDVEWYTVRIINSVHMLVGIFHDVISHFVLDTVEVSIGHGWFFQTRCTDDLCGGGT